MDTKTEVHAEIILKKLLSAKGNIPGKKIDLSLKEIHFLISEAKKIFEE